MTTQALPSLVPQWAVPTSVLALCTTRSGGVSAAPYDSLNLGDHVGDEPTRVSDNRQRLAHALGVRPVFLKQVHGVHCTVLDAHTPDGLQADACITSEPGVACTIMVADCLPVLFAHKSGLVVGAAHAGWRGLHNGVLERCAEQLFNCFEALAGVRTVTKAIKNIATGETYSGQPEEWQAWLGPCIGPGAFEVGADVRQAFLTHDAGVQQHFVALGGGKYLANLPGLARQRLRALGIADIAGNDGSRPWCTHSNASQYFSHRRDGVTGRFAACIWRNSPL